MKKAYINWSSGKDACLALYKLQQDPNFDISKLVTCVNSEENSVSMHGVPVELVKRQAQSLQIPLHIVEIPGIVSMEDYNSIMEIELNKLILEGFTKSIFGDIFLEDLRAYRENQFLNTGVFPIFPLWKISSERLIQEFLDAGFKAIVVCINSKILDKSFCGRIIDKQFLKDLPDNCDPCGENGEFHSFVFDGPNFSDLISFEKGKISEKVFTSNSKQNWDSKFYYCELIPE